MPISSFLNVVFFFLSWFSIIQLFPGFLSTYDCFSLGFLMGTYSSPYIYCYFLSSIFHPLLFSLYMSPLVKPRNFCGCTHLCGLWTDKSVPALNSKYAKHNLWGAPNIEKSIFSSQLSFC